MGQRLNIEIFNKGQILANAYYHWSAYTVASLELVQKVLDAYSTFPAELSDRQKAVSALQATGAGLPDDERETIFARDLVNLTEFKGRDECIIAVSPKNIQSTRFWEEGRVSIYIDESRIDFDVLVKENRFDYDRNTKEYYGEGGRPMFEDLPSVDWNVRDIKIEDFKSFFSLMKDIDKSDQPFFRCSVYPTTAYGII